MLYISSEKGFNRYIVCDSDTGETFEIARVNDKAYRHEKCYSVECFLGYVCGHLFEVPVEMINLLSYIERIKCTRECSSHKSIRVCLSGIDVMDKYRVLFRSESHYGVPTTSTGFCHSILDVIMCASYDESFYDCIESGTLVCDFLGKDYLIIRFCGGYKSYISKLVALYRDKWKNECKLEGVLGRYLA